MKTQMTDTCERRKKKRDSSESLEAEIIEHLREQTRSSFTSMLFKKVGDIMSHTKEINVSDASRVSGQAPKGDYSLELIQMISAAVMALDQNVQQDVLVMRKNLLYINVKECAVEADNCDDYRDLDIRSDSALLTEKQWSCPDPQCGKIYDREQMENRLVRIVRQSEKMYQIQDLLCNQVKAAHLTEQCECAGSFSCKESGSDFLKRMDVFLDIIS
ncbi:hypothetical protein Bca52824_079144 [Brassica carinata]|uniref:DNA polymerase epsilon catalytic subunit n=1 Tax=Brassica carinata TaxID=52824 RepID=A0A8X7PY14_BRACI|nr:hypothetical protein Bca52824_079144 [Brassica carinata]